MLFLFLVTTGCIVSVDHPAGSPWYILEPCCLKPMLTDPSDLRRAVQLSEAVERTLTDDEGLMSLHAGARTTLLRLSHAYLERDLSSAAKALKYCQSRLDENRHHASDPLAKRFIQCNSARNELIEHCFRNQRWSTGDLLEETLHFEEELFRADRQYETTIDSLLQSFEFIADSLIISARSTNSSRNENGALERLHWLISKQYGHMVETEFDQHLSVGEVQKAELHLALTKAMLAISENEPVRSASILNSAIQNVTSFANEIEQTRLTNHDWLEGYLVWWFEFEQLFYRAVNMRLALKSAPTKDLIHRIASHCVQVEHSCKIVNAIGAEKGTKLSAFWLAESALDCYLLERWNAEVTNALKVCPAEF